MRTTVDRSENEKRPLQKFASSRFAWDIFQGPLYNFFVPLVFSPLYAFAISELDPPAEGRILDVGSGPGYTCFMLSEEYPQASIIGVDYSKTQVNTARLLCNKKGFKNCSFMLGDAMALPFEEASFAAVISLFSIKYWPEREQGLREISRVLVPGGKALIAEGERDSAYEEIERLRIIPDWVIKLIPPVWLGERYLRRNILDICPTLEEGERICSDTGFSEISVEKVQVLPFLMMKLRK